MLSKNTKTVGQWLGHYKVKDLKDIPSPKHLFEATKEKIFENRDVFWGNKGRLLPIGKPAIIGGGPKSGKSLIGLNMGVSVATGQKLFEVFTPTITGKVLFISYEDDPTILLNRLSFFNKKGNADFEQNLLQNLYIHYGMQPLIQENKKNSTILLNDEGKEIKELSQSIKPKLIIIDTLSKSFAYSENDNVVANAMLLEIKKLFGMAWDNLHNPTLFFIQHVRKTDAAQTKELTIDSIRGAGSVAADSRTVLGFEQSTKTRKLLMLGANCGQDFDSITLTKEVHMTVTSEKEDSSTPIRTDETKSITKKRNNYGYVQNSKNN